MISLSLWLCEFPLSICILFYLAIHLGWLHFPDIVICEQISKDVYVVHPCGRLSNLVLQVQTKNRTPISASSKGFYEDLPCPSWLHKFTLPSAINKVPFCPQPCWHFCHEYFQWQQPWLSELTLTCPWRPRCWPLVFLLWRPICWVQ